ncbi:MAG: polysaccharide pyruvyl transferase family protein, partial [Candidatus Ornithomonoglobus sp.]
MKRYLVRAGFNPLKTYTPYDLLRNNFIGDNSGNLFFAYGVMNVLRTEDTEIEQTYKWRFTAEDAAIINERYDAVVLPMADAFREPFINALKGYTDLINRLTIPVVVIGIGLRAPYEPGLNNKFIFDEAAKEFVKAVLDHSAMLGLRGEIT